MKSPAEIEQQEAVKEWFRARVDQIHQHVTAYDVLASNGVELRKSGQQAEQISCPFHGKDAKPSARFFPESPESRSHVWCYVCHENWDAIGLWKKFSGIEKFGTLLHSIEKAYGLEAPPAAFGPRADREDPMKQEVERLFEFCENRLHGTRDEIEMTAHLKLGSILDHVRFAHEAGAELTDTRERLNKIIERIREKRRAKTPTDS